MKNTQYTKILDLHKNNDWVCGNTYRANYIFSAHKRRQEMIDRKMCLGFQWRPCQHGYRQVRDYMLELKDEKVSRPEEEISRQTIPREIKEIIADMPRLWETESSDSSLPSKICQQSLAL